MGFWSWVKGAAKKVGGAVTGGVKKVGSFVQQAAKKVGDVGSKVVDIAKKIQPFVKDVPIIGKAVGAVANAGDLVDLAKKVGTGDWKGAGKMALDYASDNLPGAAGEAVRRGKQIYSGGRQLGIF